MIRSIEETLIDAQSQEFGIIYFDYSVEQKDKFQNKVSYLISAFTKSEQKDEKGNDIFIERNRIPSEYKLSTWTKLFGDLTYNEFIEKEYELMIVEIGKNPKKFYGLTSDKLMKV